MPLKYVINFSDLRSKQFSSDVCVAGMSNGTDIAKVHTLSGVHPSCFGLVARTEYSSHCLYPVIEQSLCCVLELLVMNGLETPHTRHDPEYREKYAKAYYKTLGRILSIVEPQHVPGKATEVLKDGMRNFIKYFKYKLSAFFSHYEQEEIPDRPAFLEASDHPGYIFGGCIGQYMRGLATRDQSFLLSVLMLKKGLPRPPKEILRDAEIATVKELTTVRPARPNVYLDEEDEYIQARLKYINGGKKWKLISEQRRIEYEDFRFKGSFEKFRDLVEADYPLQSVEEMEKYFAAIAPPAITREGIEQQLRRTVKEVFRGKEFGVMNMSEPVFPSTSANYNNTRSEAGTVGLIKELFPNWGCALEVEPETCFLFTENDGKVEGETAISYALDFSATERAYRELYWRCYKRALAEEPICKPVALSEALKIRVISKGPALTYFCLKSFQKFLWGILSRHPTFRLIGRPVTVEDVEEVCGFDLRNWFNSGDYVSSTDRLYSWVSETLLDEMATVLKLEPTFVGLCKKALTGHIFEVDPNTPGFVWDTELGAGFVTQKTGQLMGSIISFPFLCLANAALCRWALEIAECRKVSLYNSPILINGDDNLIASKSERYHYWWKMICAIAGLDSSIGKTYFNQRFAVINSQHFDFSEGRWIERKYINMGLFYGMKRSLSGPDEKDCFLHTAACYNDLMRTCPEELREEISERFLYRHGNTLREYEGSWWLPHYCGGLGMRNESKLSRRDYKIAQGARRAINQGCRPGSWPVDKDWWTWVCAEETLQRACPLLSSYEQQKMVSVRTVFHDRKPVPFHDNPILWETGVDDLETENAAIMKLACINALLVEDLETLYPSKRRKYANNINEACKRNYKLYQRAIELRERTEINTLELLYQAVPATYFNVRRV